MSTERACSSIHWSASAARELPRKSLILTGDLAGQLADEMFVRNTRTVRSAGSVDTIGNIAGEIAKRRAHAVN